LAQILSAIDPSFAKGVQKEEVTGAGNAFRQVQRSNAKKGTTFVLTNDGMFLWDFGTDFENRKGN